MAAPGVGKKSVMRKKAGDKNYRSESQRISFCLLLFISCLLLTAPVIAGIVPTILTVIEKTGRDDGTNVIIKENFRLFRHLFFSDKQPAFEPGQWSKWRAIIPPDKPVNAVYGLIELDGRIFDQTRKSLDDVRVVDEQGKLVSHIILGDESKLHLKQIPAKLDNQGLDPDLRSSVWLLDLGYRHLPSSRLEFQPGTTNFHRRLEVQGSNDQRDWFGVDIGEIFEVRINGVKRQNLQLNYDETRFRYLRIKIFNEDNQPIMLNEVRVYGRPRRLLFQHEPGKSYRLFYGNPSVTAPRYDLERLLPYIKVDSMPLFALGEEHENLDRVSAKSQEEVKERHPAWIWVTLGAAALLLGALIYRLAKMTAG
jgi:hypothetical protein